MGLMSLFTDPAEAIMQAKMARNQGMSFFLLVIEAFLIAITFGVMGGLMTFDVVTAITTFSISLAVIIVYGVVFAGLMPLAVKAIDGQGAFFEGLTVVSYSLFVPTIAFMLATAIQGLSKTIGQYASLP